MIRGRWLLAALTVLALAWGPEWERILDPFPGHMLRHMLLVAVAAPLLALGLPVLGRFAPPVTLAAALEFLVVWAFHLPALHVPAQLMPGAFALEQAAFLLAGIAVWSSALPPTHPLAGAGGLLLTSMHMTFLGALLIFAPEPLYPPEICGPDPVAGQQAGGILMLVIGTPIYLVGGLILTARTLREQPA